MIKSFNAFDRLLENKKLFEGNEFLVHNIDLTSGSPDLVQARKFVKEMTGMEPPSTRNLGKLIDFCVDNYKGFNNDIDKGPLKPQVDTIKNRIKDFFKSTEIEDDLRWITADDAESAVDAAFRNVRFRDSNSNAKGLLQRFFDTFEYVSKNTNRDTEGLDVTAIKMIKWIVQEIKEVWDPSGWDAYAWGLGGDSDAILAFNKDFTNMYGDYVEALAKYAKEKDSAQQGTQPSTTAPTRSEPTATTRTTSTGSKQKQDWNRTKKLSFK